jgi:ribonuclease HI
LVSYADTSIVKSFPSYDDAAAFVAGRDPPSNDKPTRFYGVAAGRKPGVYTDWGLAQEAIVGWKGPKYKKFDTRAEAEEFVRTFNSKAVASATTFTAPADEEALEDVDEEQPVAKKAKKATKEATAAPVAVIYTDGSSLGNGGDNPSAGVGVYFGPNDSRFVLPRVNREAHENPLANTTPSRNISERLLGELQTNQRAELTAILRALEVIGPAKSAEIRTDSKYSIKCVTDWYRNWERNGWRTREGPVKNQDLVKAIRAKLDEREQNGARTQFTWVKGHANEPGNVAADILAVAGSRRH